MKRAFNLLELTIALVIFSIIFMLISKPLREFYLLHLKSLKQNEVISKLNQTLLNLENILLECANLESTSRNFSCFLKDDESTFVLENDKLKLVNSMLILKSSTGFYSSKSDFPYLLQNKMDLLKDGEGSFYALKNGKVELLNPANLQSEGIFYPLKAKIEFKFEDNVLKFTLKPKIFNENLKQGALLPDLVRDFSLREQSGVLWIKICVQKIYFSHCLERTVSL